MARPLSTRLGQDTVSKFEAAASRRLDEAESLLQRGRHVGAIYLYGYVAEARLQAAYYRVIGFGPNTEITLEIRRRVLARATLLRLMGRAPHNIAGWARLLQLTRKEQNRGFNVIFGKQLISHADILYGNWRPSLRYRVTIPLPTELKAVRDAAEWLNEHYANLWR